MIKPRAEDRAEPCMTDQGAALSRGRAEHHDIPSSRSSSTQKTRQPHTTQWAVARYVSSPVTNCFVPILTKTHLGTPPCHSLAEQKHAEDGRAEQQCSRDSQAEPCPDEAMSRTFTPTNQQLQAQSQTDSLAEQKHTEDGRAEQQCSRDSQSEPCPAVAVSRAVTPTHQQVQAQSQIVASA